MNFSRSCENIHIKNSKHFNPASKFRLLPLLKKSINQSSTHLYKTHHHPNQQNQQSNNNQKSGAFLKKQNNQITSRYIFVNQSVQVGATQHLDPHDSNFAKIQKIQKDNTSDPYVKMSKLGEKYVQLNEKYLSLLQNKTSSRVQSLYLSRSGDKFLRDSRCRAALSQVHAHTAQKNITSSSKASRVELEQLKSKLNQVNFSKLRQFTSDQKTVGPCEAKGSQLSQQKFIKIKKKEAIQKQNRKTGQRHQNQNVLRADKINKVKNESQLTIQKSYKTGLR